MISNEEIRSMGGEGGGTWKEHKIGSERLYHSDIREKSHQRYKNIREESRMTP